MYTVEVIKNKFWILEDSGLKIGTIRKTQNSEYEVIIKESGIEQLDFDSLKTKYGNKILESKQINKIESVDYGKDLDDVEGFPSKHKAFNKRLDEKELPIYTKTETSNTVYAAGYYGLSFPGAGWKNAYCVKRETLDNYEYIGPFKSKTQLEAEINKCMKASKNS